MSKNKVILVVLGVIIFAVILVLGGVLLYKYSTQHKTNAVVLVLDDDSILVAEYENPPNLYTLRLLDKKENILQGDKVIITHNGIILESYPSTFSKVYSIKKDGEAEISVYKEGLNIYLDFIKSFESLDPKNKETTERIKNIEDRLDLLK